MEERDPSKSNAIESSLWEIVAMQRDVNPSVAIAAKFISQPLPKHEWDLSKVLEIKYEDVSWKLQYNNINIMFFFCIFRRCLNKKSQKNWEHGILTGLFRFSRIKRTK